MKALWKFDENLYYGSLIGVFIATEEELKLLFSEGQTLYAGEVAGKHSEVQIDVNMSSFQKIEASTLLTEEQMTQFIVGYDPINLYISRFLDDLMYCETKEQREKYIYLEELDHLKDYLLSKVKGY